MKKAHTTGEKKVDIEMVLRVTKFFSFRIYLFFFVSFLLIRFFVVSFHAWFVVLSICRHSYITAISFYIDIDFTIIDKMDIYLYVNVYHIHREWANSMKKWISW